MVLAALDWAAPAGHETVSVDFDAANRCPGPLEAAVRVLDERGVAHRPLRDLVPLGQSFLAFFDPDGIALELTAPTSDAG